MEGHESLEEDDVSGAYVCRFLEAGVFDEGILGDADLVVALDEVDEGLVGEVEVEGVGVVEVVLCDVDLRLVNACVSPGVLL
jgi:hypothetical protein